MQVRIYCLFFCLLSITGWGQGNLVTNIYLFKLENVSDKFVVHSPRFITQFNKSGYNNQPFFINDHELLLSVKFPNSDQNDIFKINTTTKTLAQITNTKLSEYSPTLSADQKYLSCIRVDDVSTALQRIYQYEYKPNGLATSPLPDLKNVGYYSWLDAENIALFLVNKPNQIALVNTTSKDPLIFSSDIGRCLVTNKNGNLVYVHKMTDEFWYIKEYDHINQKATIITETLKGAEDFAITDDGSFIMGKDSKLYSLSHPAQKEWVEIADLSFFGIKNIKRLAVKGNQLAIVEQAK